ncbi:hypothetical protein NH26_23325 [Flammeovirga pacifica]|uniref:MotA/TolQ/ExbB proton channel domain-containing protein n=2 Tax=Flammeovirga pacifica TaxID=915059 RepID=A0A1S1YU22_FLAPC|nr:hypothetical protein NH26_23325 [Flammeovirga pacifica]
MEVYMLLIYSLLIGWAIFSTYYSHRVWKKGLDRVVPYVFDSIPSVFTTIGVLGTFVGIYFGLRGFDVNDITGSIPSLLEGLKTAFTTSIFGIILSLFFGKVSQYTLHLAESKAPSTSTSEVGLLQEINKNIIESQKQNTENLELIAKSLSSDNDQSLSTHLVKLRTQFLDLKNEQNTQNKTLNEVLTALGGDKETSLLSQIKNLRLEQSEFAKKNTDNIKWIIDSMKENNELISRKFDEFSELLAKNNTEALVGVMKQATEDFNQQMSSIVEKLVQENFSELNNSVEKLNTWQQENKKMVSTLTEQFNQVTSNIESTSSSIKTITENTSKLTDKDSDLKKLIIDLQEVMINDTKFKEIATKLSSTADTMKENTTAFDETTEKLNNWVRNQMNFTDSVAKLLVRLEEIEKIKDINEVFWEGTKSQLTEGVHIISNANQQLANDVESINEEFYVRLNDTLQNLDTLIQRIITNYK